MLPQQSFPHARCLDGSQAGYYIRTTNSSHNKWLIYLEGGGWCYDQTCAADTQATIANCKERSGSDLGSSKSWSATYTAQGSLSPDRRENPV